ncbi:MAG: hypothetical protein KDA69_08770, partial [Planctomycetaceae bacterium]|nr:hypothetical protein [Planctomycetaceae bacterium]
YNVPTTESELTVATDDALQQQLADVKFEIQPVGQFDWIRTDSPGSEMRRLLILAICLIGAFEQFMAYRLSYH